jgi:hypothetical protein
VQHRPASCGKSPAAGYHDRPHGRINHGLYAKMPYGSLREFTHIAMIASGPNVLAANAEFPAKTVTEFIELADRPHRAVHQGGAGRAARHAGDHRKRSSSLSRRIGLGPAPATTPRPI